ncbi:hypothetical protein MBM_01056 [Drepanopeziza brunnea f. sp. 'multigermtubi' MB_m1]|uniref:Uncharacterized protein n=1 Tax=Marssonina brunnea f. sp. multigermtubi (strain MB_m1) TaxID=1072389 RepID=K1Y5B9_MARBU|nr:uncharacterized protein MBM_01056 [Drepanopeziza brunnea f. sp. 'multigermtubi' MB_m1]EKD20374.1 hypothetical protein MBM_01056 [Drepanopeziza brunnea f. sp. 'multigermtubi' MB_m1]
MDAAAAAVSWMTVTESFPPPPLSLFTAGTGRAVYSYSLLLHCPRSRSPFHPIPCHSTFLLSGSKSEVAEQFSQHPHPYPRPPPFRLKGKAKQGKARQARQGKSRQIKATRSKADAAELKLALNSLVHLGVGFPSAASSTTKEIRRTDELSKRWPIAPASVVCAPPGKVLPVPRCPRPAGQHPASSIQYPVSASSALASAPVDKRKHPSSLPLAAPRPRLHPRPAHQIPSPPPSFPLLPPTPNFQPPTSNPPDSTRLQYPLLPFGSDVVLRTALAAYESSIRRLHQSINHQSINPIQSVKSFIQSTCSALILLPCSRCVVAYSRIYLPLTLALAFA